MTAWENDANLMALGHAAVSAMAAALDNDAKNLFSTEQIELATKALLEGCLAQQLCKASIIAPRQDESC